MKLITFLLIILPSILTGQRHGFPYYLNLQGNDKIQRNRIDLEITDKQATIAFNKKVLTYRIIKRETNQTEHVLTLSCGGRLRLEYINNQLHSFNFSCPGVVLFSSIAFCEAVDLGEYK